MASVLSAIGKVVNGIKNIKNKLNKLTRRIEFVKKHKTKIVTAIVIAFFLPVAAISAVMGAAHDFVEMCQDGLLDIVGLGSEDLYNSMADARTFCNRLETLNAFGIIDDDPENGSSKHEQVLRLNRMHRYMDTETLLLIVGEVAAYNDAKSGDMSSRSVFSEYRQEWVREGDFPYTVNVTGSLVEPTIKSASPGRVIGLIIKDQGIVTNNKNNGNDFSVIENVIKQNKENASVEGGSPVMNSGSNNIYIQPGGFASGAGFVPSGGFVPAITPPPAEIEPEPESTPVPTPEPTATPEPRYGYKDDLSKGYYDHNGQSHDTYTPSIRDIETNWDRGPNGRYERMDYMQWQPVAALCCYYISMTPDKWGTYTGSEDTHYISKEKVQELMGLFAFEYDYVQEVERNFDYNRYVFKDIIKGTSVTVPFKTSVTYEDGWNRKYRYTYRVPAWAPYRIANSYISYVYEYERGEEVTIEGDYNRYARVASVTYNVQPIRLLEAMEEKIPHFSESMYLYMLEMFPRSEESVAYFKDVIMADDNEELKTWKTTRTSDSPSIDVITGMRQYGDKIGIDLNGDSSGMEFEEGAFTIPLYAASGQIDSFSLYISPHEDILAEGETYGLYQVCSEAHAPLDVSDNLSLIEINRLVNSPEFLSGIDYTNSPILKTESLRDQLAVVLYSYQQQTQSSVCGVLGLLKQEGGFTSSYAKKGYNFFHITGGESQGYTKIGTSRFRDYKTAIANGVVRNDNYADNVAGDILSAIEQGVMGNVLNYDDAIIAFSLQVDWVYRNYWGSEKYRQNTYYKMIFNDYAKDGVTGLAAYDSMHHSYCPPWDDPAMPYSRDSYTIDGAGNAHFYWRSSSGSSHFGWANNSARNRVRLYNIAKGTE